MTFETEYQLEEFDKIKDQHFDEDGKCWSINPPANCKYIMEQMLCLINQLKSEIDIQINTINL